MLVCINNVDQDKEIRKDLLFLLVLPLNFNENALHINCSNCCLAFQTWWPCVIVGYKLTGTNIPFLIIFNINQMILQMLNVDSCIDTHHVKWVAYFIILYDISKRVSHVITKWMPNCILHCKLPMHCKLQIANAKCQTKWRFIAHS